MNFTLTAHQLELCNLGLKHILVPPPVPDSELTTVLKKLIRDIRLRCHFHTTSLTPYAASPFRISKPSFNPPLCTQWFIEKLISDITFEFNAIMKKYPPTISQKYIRHYNHQQHLRKAGLALLALGIIFKPTDKNLGTILLDVATYLALGHPIVDDTTTYLLQPPPTLASVFHTLNIILTKHKAQISPRIHAYIMQMQHIDTVLTAAILYLLPKVHKTILEARPVVTNSNYYTFYPSKYLHHILRPLLKIIPTYITSSTHLITTLNETKYPSSAVLCSFDITALYPSIPIIDGLAALKLTMEQANWPTQKIIFILELAEWVLTNSHVMFDEKTYKQIMGTAMGTPFAVTYANIFVHQHECSALSKFFAKFHHLPLLIRRLIDDIFAIVRSIAEAKFLFECLTHSGIIITGGHDENSVDFLDITIFKGFHFENYNMFDTKLYQKHMNTYAYITFISFHKPQIFTNFITGEIRRYTIANSNLSDYTTTLILFKNRLLARKFPLQFIDNIYNTTSFNRQHLIHTAKLKIAKLMTNDTIMTDPTVITSIPIHIPYTTRHVPISSIEILHKLPDYIWSCPVGKLIFNEQRPFLFTTTQSPSNHNVLVRSDTLNFYKKCTTSTNMSTNTSTPTNSPLPPSPP